MTYNVFDGTLNLAKLNYRLIVSPITFISLGSRPTVT